MSVSMVAVAQAFLPVLPLLRRPSSTDVPPAAVSMSAPPAFFRRGDAHQLEIRFSLLAGERLRSAQQFHHLRHPAEMVDAMPAARDVALQLFAPPPGHAAIDDIEERLGRQAILSR